MDFTTVQELPADDAGKAKAATWRPKQKRSPQAGAPITKRGDREG